MTRERSATMRPVASRVSSPAFIGRAAPLERLRAAAARARGGGVHRRRGGRGSRSRQDPAAPGVRDPRRRVARAHGYVHRSRRGRPAVRADGRDVARPRARRRCRRHPCARGGRPRPSSGGSFPSSMSRTAMGRVTLPAARPVSSRSCSGCSSAWRSTDRSSSSSKICTGPTGRPRDLLAYLIHQLGAARVAIVTTYRADELNRRHPLRPWLAELERSGRAERVDLERFDRDDVAAQLQGILGEVPTPRSGRGGLCPLRRQRLFHRGARRRGREPERGARFDA